MCYHMFQARLLMERYRSDNQTKKRPIVREVKVILLSKGKVFLNIEQCSNR
jgi:hypothetical protein